MKFTFTETGFEGLMIIEPQVYSDQRGYFFESFNSKEFLLKKADYFFVQDNESASQYGVIRGLHFQTGKMEQAKLVRVIRGEVMDVVLDLRKGSDTYLKCFQMILSDSNKKQLLIPGGFAHGFAVRTEFAIFSYKCDNYYSPPHERGIHPLDPSLKINWGIEPDKIVLSERDSNWPGLEEYIKDAD
ncbi:MAG: dTDP-4-dehydrorhamnose 3,5-epimerase [Saprospiraceae bacterium]|nr:dTDP-4-dehydrorhamnose 3,5-epimerase [Saprospiraceae bacterium]